MPFQALRFLRDDLKNRRIVTMRKILLLISVSLFFAAAVFAQGMSTSATSTTAAAVDAPARAPSFTPTKDQIMQGQKLLKEKKLYTGEATGVYGESRPAIKAYQKENGLEQTGRFDKASLEKMKIVLTDKQNGIDSTSGPLSSTSKTTPPSTASTTSTANSPKKPAPFQASKDQIMALQKILKDAKMYSGEANGERSDELKEAVKKYQEANGLKVTGGINAATLEKTGIALTDAQKANVAAQAAYDAAKKN